jgi:Flp pilus assembly protein TadG
VKPANPPQSLSRKLLAWRDNRGNTAILFALLVPVLVGGAGLAVETSFDYVSQSRLQGGADAAAYAAALENMAGSNSATIAAAANQQATANGWASATGALTVTTPPTSGAYAGLANAVQVQLTAHPPRFFTAYFSSTPVTLTARAVAISQTAANACILALNRTASQAIQVQGNTAVTLSGCDVMSDSVANDAVNIWGSANLHADCAVSVGGVTNHGGLTLGCGAPLTQAPRVGDPFANLATPAPGQHQSIPGGSPHGVTTLQPGSYNSGMSLSGDIVLQPGVYYVSGGDFSVGSNATVSGSGVTIYLAAGSNTNFNGNAIVNLSAPTAGAYSGILFFGARDGTGSNIFNGDASSHLTGDIYFPSQAVDYRGNFSGINGCTQIIADTVQWTGSTTIAVDCAAQGMGNIPARLAVKLVE